MAITVSAKEGVVIFRINGRIIVPDSKKVSETLEAALSVCPSPPRLIFSFKEVTGVDSSGLGVLMKVYSDIHLSGGKIGVINVNKRVKNLIVMARLITVFKNFESEDDTIAALLQDANYTTLESEKRSCKTT